MNNITATDSLEVYGARVHNLKNIDVTIPHNSLCVITGLSGCGKSSLAFDTIFAEGQRRYIETFSSYARNMLGSLERPDVDKITGLNPVISIEQKTVNKNPRSTIGTTTEIYDFFRLLFARLGEARSYISGKPMVKYSKDKIVSLLLDNYDDRKIQILAPIVKNRKGHYKELFETLRKKGYLYVRIDGTIKELSYGMKLDRYKNHSIEIVIDRLRLKTNNIQRLRASIDEALKQGDKELMILDMDSNTVRYYSQLLMDSENGLSYPEAAPHNFSFNSPHGYCPKCRGLGVINIIDENKIIPNKNLSIYDGAITPLGKYKNSLIFWQLEAICRLYDSNIKTPWIDLPEDAKNDILNGTDHKLDIQNATLSTSYYADSYEGLIKFIEAIALDEQTGNTNKLEAQFFSKKICPECKGDRLNKIALHYYIDNKSIGDVARMDISELYEWTKDLEEKIDPAKRVVAIEILKEINSRLRFLLDVGLDYLSLNRSSASLSGGESQRIRLATQIGTQLINVLYILDEPSIGLHQRDNIRLINSLKQLRDSGNSVIVVEHDKDIMTEADYIIDIGPGAGRHGGNVVFQGAVSELMNNHTLTASYLNGERTIPIPNKRRIGNGKFIDIYNASGHNLKNVHLHLPLGLFVCVTGVSGSGKSSLINGTLQPILSKKFYRSLNEPLPYKEITGIDNIDKIVTVDQTPLGRSPRSNPATYTGVFSDIRKLFVDLPDSKLRGYKAGRFSFNVAGGRCETCKGNGYRTIEMNFLPDVLVPCETCHGKRYNRETLEVRFKGKSISDVLDMTVNQAVDFFENIPNILKKIKVLQDVGLGYLKLGQPSSTLSGGENQRVKLATELSKKDTGKTLFILDEPTTGLHFEDIRVLLKVINRLVDKGNTMIVIEHNLDIIKCADYVIDMGPEGGRDGGRIIASGTPEDIAQTNTHTAQFLKKELNI
ncbi:excinuclease ABC subunit UvrA [Lepagella muris]|jgi:excinuclease ABC subunit A|uniref:Excinuclease ABC subunit UvrA n=1 Tax=Lepagella muris TaxID=3032870 RepID=A0AC61RBD4_9BACT|nr:excinuclease ABC subunit UvrA [Lepagella muris]ROT09330.1 excinuclease ABC subunit UvrA [Muribaculaceae bacterium Isolate-037 (Harlan)]TGY75734.1 excinuclease ABC subunit UvrA [Lepagella muris]THG46113.1 excinuclease ABC subunit UvrA [Bacteroidales bacterium]TKC54223.1 excinuclease ABC subunit UvrA [Bacteroidales bacterium]